MTSINLFRNATNVLNFSASQTIFRQGQITDVIYIIIAGEIDIVVGGEIIATVEAGNILGEMGLVGVTTRSATAIARTDCKLVPISQRQFDFMVQQTPYFSSEVIEILCERLRSMNSYITQKTLV